MFPVPTLVLALWLSASGTTGQARTLDAITIEGEIDMPEVLFITARDQYRYMDFLHRRYDRSMAQLGTDVHPPRRLELLSKEN